MTEPQLTPAGEDPPISEAERPPWSREVTAHARQIAAIGGRLAEAGETLRDAGGFQGSGGQAGELARLLADLSRDREGQLDANERLDRRLDALGQDVEAHRQALAELENHLEDLTTLAGELAGRQAAEARGERAIWWPDVPAGPERTAALHLLRTWVDDVLRGHHPGLVTDSLQARWYRHEDVLDELTALHAAYRGTAAPATAAIEWHDRWLPGCLARCKAAIKARPCDQDGHQSPPGTEAPDDSVALNGPAEPWAREVTASARTPWAGERGVLTAAAGAWDLARGSGHAPGGGRDVRQISRQAIAHCRRRGDVAAWPAITTQEEDP